MLKSSLVIVGLAACSPNKSVEPQHVEASRSRARAAPSLSVWSSTLGESSSAPTPGRWLTTRTGERDAVLVVLGRDGLQFVDPHGRRLAEIPASGHDAGALDVGRGIVWLGGGRRIAAIDLLADELRVAVLADDLLLEGYAVQLASAPVLAPELLVGVDATDEPGTAYMLLDWSRAEPSLAKLVVGEDGDAIAGPPVARWDARWLAARAERVAWPTVRSQLHGRHPACPKPHGDLDCQPFGRGALWLVAVDEEIGDVPHVDALLYDAQRERWVVPRDDVAPPALRWTDGEPSGIEFAVTFDLGGQAYTTMTHVCEIDGGCRSLDGEALGFLGGGLRVGTSS